MERETAPTRAIGDRVGVAPTADPLIKERVRRVVRERLFAIAEPPVTVGRFVILDRLGAGGMATVYAAYDPQLEREVAVKVVRNADDDRGDAQQQRMVREAKLMARLSHPNVATVYDAGVFDAEGHPKPVVETLLGELHPDRC